MSASFNIKRFDPSTSTSTSTEPSSDSNLVQLAQKIKDRKLAKSLLQSTPTPTTTQAEVAVPVVPEWQPPPGESPAEREKRVKKEKRAIKLGLPFPSSSTSTLPPPPAQVHVGEWQAAPGESPAEREKRIKREKRGGAFNALPPTMAEEERSAGGVGMSIHPDRMEAVPDLFKVKEKGPPKEKTTAKKKYLKKKKIRAKGRKAGTGIDHDDVEGEGDEDDDKVKVTKQKRKRNQSDSDSGSEDDDEPEGKKKKTSNAEEEKAKREEIIKKKAERKLKRDAKKAELKRLKGSGELPPPPPPKPSSSATPKPLPSIPTPLPTVDIEMSESITPPTTEEDLARIAKKEAKRLKRATRGQSPPPVSEPSTESFPLPTQPSLPTQLEPESLPETEPEPKEPLLLHPLPAASNPLPPSAKTLSKLNIHESVRNKIIVDPEKKLSLTEFRKELGLSDRSNVKLSGMGFEEAFAVQTEVFPILLVPIGSKKTVYNSQSGGERWRDLCVSAPTGSGKTLAYVVPIVEVLSTRIVTRLRALILLPTHELVPQVKKTFEIFAKGTGILIGTATGQHSFSQEQSNLVGNDVTEGTQGGSSKVDILIATPGRLMDHIRSTPGFSLQHLRFLVIDEADRLLNQSFHDWLPSILFALNPTSSCSSVVEQNGRHSDALAPQWWDSKFDRIKTDFDEKLQSSCQKLLFSATLSRDPAKIDALDLNNPIFVSVEDELDGKTAGDEGVDDELKFTLPATLREFMITSPSTHKPLYLFHLLHTVSVSSALCFTKSVEAATRLAKLVEFFEEALLEADSSSTYIKVVVNTYSSDLPASERTRIMESFKKGEIQMLICSDLIARGIDLPHVSHVISYDVPTDMRRYVHRVGRTARAGKSGDAWSLVEDPEVAPFREILKSAQHWDKIKRVRVKDSLVEPFVPHYQAALDKLKAYFASGREKEDLLLLTSAVNSK